ncbi:YegP family protein [Candidatus Berkelbacteria bacterium]|nr:YegP family protein [Candidatus Berkelbacteria bacterium]
MAKFEIYLDRAREYRWRLKAANGEIVAASEGYTSKQSAITSVQLIKRLAPMAPVYDLTR